jgi:hypothetical protein
MVNGLFAPTSGFKNDAEVFFQFTLTNKVVEMTWAQPTLFANDVGASSHLADLEFGLVGSWFW